MKKTTSLPTRLCCTALVASVLTVTGLGPAYADPPGQDNRGSQRDYGGDHRGAGDRNAKGDQGKNRANQRGQAIQWKSRGDNRNQGERRDNRGDNRNQGDHRGYRADDRGRNQGYTPRPGTRAYHPAPPPRVVYRDRDYHWHGVPRDRVRRFRNIEIVRPYGHWYSGYGHFYRDDDAYKWLAFTAITLGVLNFMNEAQQREYEAAQVAAVTAPIGERIVWSEGGASGSVIPTREGTSTDGRYCREFQQDVTVGGRVEQAYGTACMNPDGSWEVVSTDDQ
jgi:17 kDa outer membrane surface antigen